MAFVIAGVCAAGGTITIPRPGRDSYRAPWRDGANLIRVQELGPNFILVTLAPSRIVDSARVETRTPAGEYLGEKLVFLLADGIALAESDKPTREWWNRALEIERTPRIPVPQPKLPSADTGGPQ